MPSLHFAESQMKKRSGFGQLLTAAIQLTSPTFEFDSEHMTCLTQAIRQAMK